MSLTGSVLAVTAFAGFWVFVILYGARSDWRSTEPGRNLMAFMVVCGIVLSTSFMRPLLGDARWDLVRDEIRIVSFALVNWVLWWRVYLLLKVQRQTRQEAETVRVAAEAIRVTAEGGRVIA